MAELNLNDLAVFARVVERGSFAEAARELGCPTSTVSRCIVRLEQATGMRLLQRTTRSVRPTSEGREVYANVGPALTTLQRATRAIEPATRKPKGRLRVAAPNELCATFLADVVVAFVERYPLVQLDFGLENRQANLVDEGFDVAVRAAVRLRDSTLVARKLGDLSLSLYASPAYLQTHGTPTTTEALHEHRCVVFRADELEKSWPLHDRTLTRGPQAPQIVRVRGRLGGDDLSFVRAAILAGGGIGMLPQINAAQDEASGRLVRVLPTFSMPGASLYILYPSARNLPARVSAFRDFVIEAFDAWVARSRVVPQ